MATTHPDIESVRSRDPETGRVLSKYTEEIARHIVDRISDGVTLNDILRDRDNPVWGEKGPPSKVTVFEWEKVHPDFKAGIEIARKTGFDALANDLIATAHGVKAEEGDIRRLSSGDVARDKLIIDTKLKLLSKWSPRYAERVMHVGGDEEQGDKPIRTQLDVTALTEEQLRALSSIKVG